MKEIRIEIKSPKDVLKYKECPQCKTALEFRYGRGYNFCPHCNVEYLFVIDNQGDRRS